MIGFLANLKIQLNICIEAFLPCASVKVAGITVGTSVFEMGVDFQPLAGYQLIFSSLGIIGNLMVTSTELFIGQLMLVTVSLYIWPFLLFIGFVLRSTVFTRKLGGLFIALAIAAVMIYPAVFAFEYLALGNGFTNAGSKTNPITANAPSVYGFNSMLQIPDAVYNSYITYPYGTGLKSTIGVTPNKPSYSINFFVEPSIATIANYYGCYPLGTQPNTSPSGVTTVQASNGNLLLAEMGDQAYLTFPVVGALTTLASTVLSFYNTFANGVPTYPLPFYCAPQNALSFLFVMLQVYGLLSVTAYFLPVINIIIVLVAVQGLSSLFGGDTNLGGLGRFI